MNPTNTRLASVLVLNLLWAIVPATDAAHGQEREQAYPSLKLLTDAGELELELFTDAAPTATARLLTMAAGTLPGDWSLEDVRPYSMVISSEIPHLAGHPLPLEIDARRLGLDRDRIPDAGTAMTVLQEEILPIHLQNKLAPPTETFRRWIQTWRAMRVPDFLVGLNRQQLFEGFGHVYKDGLASRRVERGSVLLRPSSPEHAQPRLVFSLADRPLKTGRWMVIGRVTRGLEILRDLSIAPLADEFAKSGRLARPAAVTSIAAHLPAPDTARGASTPTTN